MKNFFKNPIHIVMSVFVIIVLFAGIQAYKNIKAGKFSSHIAI